MTEPIEVRRATDADVPEVLELLGASLGWVPDADTAAYFAWKHRGSPLGPSPAWVAVADGRILGFRTFLRWEYETPEGLIVPAVRAVDTATHPDAAGRGIFRTLTTQALTDLAAEGIGFVFNTPNANSRPGYLKMGWRDLGRIPTSISPTGLAALSRVLRSREPADRASLYTEVGVAAPEALADPRVPELLSSLAPAHGLRTHRTIEHLRWRYGYEPLRYRVLQLDDDPRGGLAIFRLRRRGLAIEAALCELLAPGADAHAGPRLLRAVRRHAGADYVIRFGGPAVGRDGSVRLSGQGPRLTWREVTTPDRPQDVGAFELSLGDIELL